VSSKNPRIMETIIDGETYNLGKLDARVRLPMAIIKVIEKTGANYMAYRIISHEDKLPIIIACYPILREDNVIREMPK